MKLDVDKQNQLIAKLNGFRHSNICSVCGNSKWSASDTIFELREFKEGNLIIGGNQPIFPVMPITCNICGNTNFINPIILGILDSNNEAKK